MLQAPGLTCYACHSVGGASENVIAGTRLIKKDARMVEILNGGWSGGQLPCVFCHDNTSASIRENMVGVKGHFSDGSLSKHPADPYAPGNGDGGNLDCADCHTNVTYVGGGNTINPNIHGQDMEGVNFSVSTGKVSLDATFRSYTGSTVSPYNAGGNTFCTQQCHDPGHTGYAANTVAHGITSGALSLDLDSGFSSTVAGCLDETGTTGCHGSHNADNNVGLLTIRKAGGGDVTRSDCGVCHTNDDGTAWSQHGHGKLSATSNIKCTSCHDASAPHFDTDGELPASNPGLLSFAVSYGNVSGLTGLPVYANCVSSNCHAGYAAHTTQNVGCIDCHDPHGAGVSPNLKMVRRTIPGGSMVMQFTTAGQYWGSGTPPGTYSNWMCDNQDCHGGSGPGPFVDLGGVHSGITGGCDSCHVHTGAVQSWEPPPCDTCHGYPPLGGGFVDHKANLTAPLNWAGLMGAHDDCLVCHGKKDGESHSGYLSTYHGDGSVTMNSDAGYDGNGGCDAACHANDAVHRMGTSSSRPSTLAALGSGDSATCRFCHEAGIYGAKAIPAATSPHLDADGSGTGWSSGDCMGCHAGHAGAAGAVTIPLPPASWSDPSGRLSGTNMQIRLGIEYAGTGHDGISLGGQGTAASAYTTEAEICWGCHSALSTPVSEWGYNTKTNTTMGGFATVWSSFPTQHDGTAQSRNYGHIYQGGYTTPVTDWTAGFWMSEYDALLKRRIASVHSVSFDVSGQSSSVGANVVGGTNKVRQGPGGNPYGDTALSPILEDVRYIRCSYCHDVHDTFGPGGKPYLRGAWVGDPYPPELPPRNTYTYTTRVPTAGSLLYSPYMPRGRSTARDRGGYFIDQNSGWPTTNTAMDTVNETSELCTLCHGTNIDTMDFYTSSSLWRFAPPGKNGHSNAALGGTRSTSLISDIFTGLRYNAGMGMQMAAGTCPGWLAPQYYPCGDYGNIGDCDTQIPLSTYYAHYCDPSDEQIVGNSGWYDGDYANWYGSGTIGGASAPGAKAHDFTCSKCHSPHATGLPALLPQNCIDPLLGNFTFTTTNNPNTYRGNNQMANNCHRKTAITDGWHKLAPRQ